ncbi:molybdopterin molybdotransferase MoeA [Sphingobacterium cellulitidis]|uniref:Molybdopterin molybdenumtransferase n=1 Tax=Sphingobacterium cellulitidis TaxID=1768011 RepID=A0A8H9FYH4_9SPHI|nr:molybdopterin molybdotransferase MoeA [Sphingobacterium soli]MBA8986973.1 molybdopterin molybdotransferase [Sphingobacterium soli]GGE15342.1 molybdopterin molybdenumtransferase MoeA [Sphingobacterium soli]
MEMITVEQAEKIILNEIRDFGIETIPINEALGRVLAEDLFADRDLPPFDRATVDGIAIQNEAYQGGIQSFRIKGIQAAGEVPISVDSKEECIEIMTGAALDQSLDTIIRYEDITISNGIATLQTEINKGQNIHPKGKDKLKSEVLVSTNQIITPAILGIAASIGKVYIQVKKLPRVAIISTGDEMVPADTEPTAFQLRRSNGISIRSVLERYKIEADSFHLNDDLEDIKKSLEQFLKEYDVLILSGGVSMGKYDYLPTACLALGIEQLFHKIKQRPGKPFWFGKNKDEKLVFAFPGNPVSVFMCLHRYFIPWLENSLQVQGSSPVNAVLQNDIDFSPSLQYFAQVKLRINEVGLLTAESVHSNGSGDYSHLAETNAFIELPMECHSFKKGEIHKVWIYNY